MTTTVADRTVESGTATRAAVRMAAERAALDREINEFYMDQEPWMKDDNGGDKLEPFFCALPHEQLTEIDGEKHKISAFTMRSGDVRLIDDADDDLELEIHLVPHPERFSMCYGTPLPEPAPESAPAPEPAPEPTMEEEFRVAYADWQAGRLSSARLTELRARAAESGAAARAAAQMAAERAALDKEINDYYFDREPWAKDDNGGDNLKLLFCGAAFDRHPDTPDNPKGSRLTTPTWWQMHERAAGIATNDGPTESNAIPAFMSSATAFSLKADYDRWALGELPAARVVAMSKLPRDRATGFLWWQWYESTTGLESHKPVPNERPRFQDKPVVAARGSPSPAPPAFAIRAGMRDWHDAWKGGDLPLSETLNAGVLDWYDAWNRGDLPLSEVSTLNALPSDATTGLTWWQSYERASGIELHDPHPKPFPSFLPSSAAFALKTDYDAWRSGELSQDRLAVLAAMAPDSASGLTWCVVCAA